MAKTEYKVLKGIDYPPNKRAEIGAIVSDLPKESISWLLSSGIITDDLKSEVPVQVAVEPEVLTEPVVEEVISEPVESFVLDETPLSEEIIVVDEVADVL